MNPYVRPKMPDPVEVLTFTYSDFSGGLCNKVSPLLLRPNQARDLLNMKFISANLMEKRQGTKPIDDLVLDKPIRYMDVYRPINKSHVLIRATENEVYAGTTKICNVSGVIQGVNYIGNYYFVDGSKFYQYDGTNVYEIVDPPHSELASSTSSGATSITLTKWDDRIKVGQKIQIEGFVTNVITISTINKDTKVITFTPATTSAFDANTFVRLFIPADPSNLIGIWKIDEALKLKWYEPCDQELDDTFKGECYIPSNCSSIALDSERIYLAGDSGNPHSIYISDINNPFYLPVELGMQTPPNGDKIIDILQFDDAIVVGRSEDIHVITGETNNTNLSSYFVMRQFDTHTGFASKNNARLANNYMFFLGSDMNIYAMHTTQTSEFVKATTILNKDTIDLKQAPLNFTYDDIKNSPAIYFEDEYYIIVGDKVLVYHYVNKAWTVYYGMNATYFCIMNNVLYIGTSTGKVMQFSEEYNDDGEPIDAYYHTGNDNLGYAVNYKDFLDVYAVTHTYEEYSSAITITTMIDYNEIDDYFEINNKISKFGVTKFGEILISRNVAQTDNIPVDSRGRVISLIFSNNKLNQPMKLYQVSGTYKIRGVR